MKRFTSVLILLVLLTPGIPAISMTGARAEPRKGVLDFNKVIKNAGIPAAPTCAPESPIGPLDGIESARWTKAGFKNAQAHWLGAEQLHAAGERTRYTHGIQLTAVMFRNAGWKKKQIVDRLKRTAQIYGQCGIKVISALLVEADAPDGKVDIRHRTERNDLRIAEMTPPSDKPILYYVRSSQDEGTGWAWAWAKRNGKEPALTDTTWFTETVGTPEYEMSRDLSYSPEAHELGHVFGDCDHYEGSGKNFLSGVAGMGNDKILPSQCDSMKQHPRVTPL